jgi:CsoR family transcriptional regulator, copper-sensing transcriptional repressor
LNKFKILRGDLTNLPTYPTLGGMVKSLSKSKPNKQRALVLAKQAQGTLAKVIEMIENDIYCVNVIQQTASAIGTLKAVEKELMEQHLQHCVENNLKSKPAETTSELLTLFQLSRKHG